MTPFKHGQLDVAQRTVQIRYLGRRARDYESGVLKASRKRLTKGLRLPMPKADVKHSKQYWKTVREHLWVL